MVLLYVIFIVYILSVNVFAIILVKSQKARQKAATAS